MECVPLNFKDHEAVVRLCRSRSVGLVVVGPEAPLAEGLADALQAAQIACFGPSAAGAQVEADKAATKRLMRELDIPTADFETFTDAEEAKQYIRSGGGRLVVKAAGLAAGKGVVVASDEAEACRAVDAMLLERTFGEAGSTIVVEQKLSGEELSLMAFTDGQRVALMPPAQDHKRLRAGDRGPNTGGMGAAAPAPGPLSDAQLAALAGHCFQPLVDHWRAGGVSYVGVLYAGLMVTADGPRVLEYNCRLGDPEAQAVLPLLQTDLFAVLTACVEGRLEPSELTWRSDVHAVDVVLVSDGYPGAYPTGCQIAGLEEAAAADCLLFHAGTRRDDGGALLTSGGRVLNVVAVRSSVAAAREAALAAADRVQFQGKQYRQDIAARALAREILCAGRLTYKSAGVDIGAGDAFVSRISALLRQRPASVAVRGGLGGFGGVYDLAAGAADVRDPLLVAGTDGVGTKLKVAQACGRPAGLGRDLVAMCVNDLLCQGGRPLLFLDYLAAGRLESAPLDQLVSGVLDGCRLAGCDLLGGETAEMPGVYSEGAYDLAGFAVGVVERAHCLPRPDLMRPGDALLALPASGLHSNGFSLVRRVVAAAGLSYERDTAPFMPSAASLGEALLTPTAIYTAPLLALAAAAAWLALVGGISAEELARTFNLGLGMVLVAPAERREEALQLLEQAGHPALSVGRLEERQHDGAGDTAAPQVLLDGLQTQLSAVMAGLTAAGVVARPVRARCRVGVLISGSGTNLQALIDYAGRVDSSAELALVISNKDGVKGLERARAAGVPCQVIRHTAFAGREQFDLAMHAALEARGVQLVCCAGFMRILSARFVQLWRGRLLNIHPSLLPAFPGLHVHRQVLEAGVRLSGCSVHFVEEEVDAGALLVQRAVPVLPADTEAQLEERVKVAEHAAYPEAVELVASGAVRLGEHGRLVWRH
ncbi:trifunctional purine biosynthetic protein adenosine-3-like [Pollicipes pollicipes]|uniref:trifunctional purine biosynthetic protein adenosine-3-like n=1 Tax=Pollicipes pollicipes TaxID=41117 RepID=UPI001884FF29|nr:trifunctional purine biosynthetic protein adenosine-3-like [Pollicipes pollicipes]